MADMTGVVQAINAKPVSGGKTAYDIVVAGQSYGVGLYAPKCKIGDYVKFEIDDSRGYKNVARNSLKVSANKPPAEAMEQAAATAPSVSTTGGTVDHRQEVISRQAASNTAIEFMKVLSANDALGLPKTDTKGKRMEVLEAMLAKYTQEFYEKNTGVVFKDISPSGSKDTISDEAEASEEVEATPDEQWT
jgi:hypothetical protein